MRSMLVMRRAALALMAEPEIIIMRSDDEANGNSQ